MSKPIILTDIDGVVLEWVSNLPFFLQRYGKNPEIAIKCQVDKCWAENHELFDTPDKDRAWELFVEYCSSDLMKTLSPFEPTSLKVINRLKKHFDFVAITAIGTDPFSKMYRASNLEALFPGAFKEVHCVEFGASKVDVLKQYVGIGTDVVCYIDDSNAHVIDAMKLGFTGIQFGNLNRGECNTKMKFDRFVNSWYQFEGALMTGMFYKPSSEAHEFISWNRTVDWAIKSTEHRMQY